MKRQVSLSIVIAVAMLLFATFFFFARVALASPTAISSDRGWREVTQPNAGPDLTVTGITLNPPTPGAGQTADITPIIKNIGDASAGSISMRIYVDPVDNPPTLTTPVTAQTFLGIPLAAGATFNTFTTGNRPFTKADWTVCTWVDPTNQVQESDESNNLLCISAGGGDTYEEDDVCPQAKAIATDGTIQEHNLFRTGNMSDTDWISMPAVSGVTYVAQAIAVGADADLYLELHSTCDGSPSFGSGAILTFTAPSTGDYYLRVGHNQPDYGPNTDYQFKVTAQNACSASFEPNDLCSVPVDVTVGAAAQTQSFCTENDVDWARFSVKAGGKYRVKTTNVGNKADVQTSLFTSCEGASADNGQQIEFTAAAAGFIYLKTANLDPKIYGTDTDYTLNVETIGSGECEEDGAEQDDAVANAVAVSVDGAAQPRNVCPAGDVDWIKFTAQQGANYTIETLNLAAQGDTVLCLHDVNGAQIRCDNDSGAGDGSRLSIENATAGDYFFKVKNANPDAAGAPTGYDIQVITGKCKTDSLEPDNDRAAARPLATDGTLQRHNICVANDVDWLSFNANANTSYVISTTALGAEADTEIEIYGPDGSFLARNDDHAPGIESQIVYNVSTAGAYTIKVQLYNQQRYGAGTEYGVSVRAGSVNPVITPVPTPTPTPTATPQASGVRTLILVNHARLTQLYSADAANQVLGKLNELAGKPDVKGEVLRLDTNTEISAAYAAWTADITNVEKANGVATEIRRLIMNYLAQRSGVEYIVLVGNDEALPMRRVADNTPRQSEKTYTEVDATHPTGAAIRANYFMTDDFYGDREPTAQSGREVYIPDLAIGRLIETPTDMIALIDAFIAQPMTTVDQVLVTGYDFVQDTAQGDCADWKTVFTSDPSKVACLIGTSWPKQDFTNLQFKANPAFKVQSISGHANHHAEGAAGGGSTSADEVVAASMDLSGGLIYTLGCHGGLNVPATNSTNPLDLAEAFARKRTNYVGNTGYGWGLLNNIGLSEKVIRLFTKELIKTDTVAMGKALAKAKSLYFEQDQNFSAYDEKVMQQLIFYGLPMFQLHSNGSLSLGGEFPGVDIDFDGSGSLGDNDVITKPVKINFQKVLDEDPNNGTLSSLSTDNGEYFSLYGSTSADANEPVQPLYFRDVSVAAAEARSVVLLGASIASTTQNFDPLVGTPVNEYVSDPEAALDASLGWYPASPVEVTGNNGESHLLTQLSQFNASSNELRLFSNVEAEVYYSTSTDQTPPEITIVDGLYSTTTQKVQVKVGVVDASGMKEVTVSYIEDERQTSATIKSVKLTFDASSQKWRGSFTGDINSLFFVQAVDNAGNLLTASNKGNYYRPASERAGRLSSNTMIYLPVIRK